MIILKLDRIFNMHLLKYLQVDLHLQVCVVTYLIILLFCSLDLMLFSVFC